MKALVLTEYKQFSVTDMPEPALGPNDVLIRVKACGICGSDVHGMDGSTGRRRPPIVMGHEASGNIEKLGSAVKDYKIGDRVTFDSTIYNPDSFFSKRGQINLCDDRRVLGVSCEDYRQHGAFAELVAVPQHILYALPPGMSYEQAALVEPVSIAVHARNLTPIDPGDTAVVYGAGLIGLMTVQVLKNTPCKQIIAVDIDDSKLTVRGAIAGVRKGGTVTLVGNLAKDVSIPLQQVVTRQIRLQGSCASAGEYPECLELIASGKVNVDRFISATGSLEEGSDYFHRLYQREPGLMKVVLKPNG